MKKDKVIRFFSYVGYIAKTEKTAVLQIRPDADCLAPELRGYIGMRFGDVTPRTHVARKAWLDEINRLEQKKDHPLHFTRLVVDSDMDT